MAGTLTLFSKVNFLGDKIRRTYVFVPSATAGQGYTSGTGENINFTTALNTAKISRPIPPGPPAAPLPTVDQIWIERIPAGYAAEIKPAAASPTLKNFNLRIFASSATEISTADYPAGLAGKDIVFEVVTAKRYS